MEFVQQALIRIIGFAYEILARGVTSVVLGSDMTQAGSAFRPREVVEKLSAMELLLATIRRKVLPAALVEAMEADNLDEAEEHYKWLITGVAYPEQYDYLRNALDIEQAYRAWKQAHDELDMNGMKAAVVLLELARAPQSDIDEKLDEMDWMKGTEAEREAIQGFNIGKNLNESSIMERARAQLAEATPNHRQLARWDAIIAAAKSAETQPSD